MEKKGKRSSIQLYDSTIKKLAKLGKKGDSYEDIILKLIKKK